MSDGSRSSRPRLPGPKVFNDAVHGIFELPPLCVRIIDTPEFQRLRFVKQIGPTYYVYPAASHNRFEHSLGVSFLAGHFAEQLKLRQPELKITDKDVLCVQVAGLCHDLGHGPFSHLWQEYMQELRPDWKHEEASAKMLDHLLAVNHINISEYGLYEENDLTFIKELFLPANESDGANGWPYRGREDRKSFLYQIVANSENGVDVDKFDYFLRDSHNLGVSVTFDYKRLMQHSRVVKVPGTGRRTICWQDKEAESVFELFSNRFQLHKKAYQHRVTQRINVMIIDVLRKAGSHLKYEGSDGRSYSLPETVENMSAYSQLTDDVLMQVLRLETVNADIREAKEIVNRILTRNLYTTVGRGVPPQCAPVLQQPVLQQPVLQQPVLQQPVLQQPRRGPANQSDTRRSSKQLTKRLNKNIDTATKPNNIRNVALYIKALSSFAVDETVLNFGNKENNPLDKLWFFSKNDDSQAFRLREDQVSALILPKSYQEVTVRVSSRSDEEEVIRVLQNAFENVCRESHWRWSQDDRRPLQRLPSSD